MQNDKEAQTKIAVTICTMPEFKTKEWKEGEDDYSLNCGDDSAAQGFADNYRES